MASKSCIGKGGKFTKRERDFIKAVYPDMRSGAIAKKLGRSKSGVCNQINRMKAAGELREHKSTDGPGNNKPLAPLDESEGQDTLGRLRRLRSKLEDQLEDAGPNQIARISAEYRAVVEEIARIENSEGGGEDDVIGKLAGAIAQKFGQA